MERRTRAAVTRHVRRMPSPQKTHAAANSGNENG